MGYRQRNPDEWRFFDALAAAGFDCVDAPNPLQEAAAESRGPEQEQEQEQQQQRHDSGHERARGEGEQEEQEHGQQHQQQQERNERQGAAMRDLDEGDGSGVCAPWKPTMDASQRSYVLLITRAAW
eukprot:SAG11_NODE_5458_length_1554_cov_1.050172_1_plen_126_part_00